MQLDYETILRKIIEVSGKTREDIEALVQAKVTQLSDLVSREGAAHIVANELGVKVYEAAQKQKYKVEELKAGLRAVDLAVKIVQKYEVRSFTRNGREGRVASMLTGDETGMVRVVLWDEGMIDKSAEAKDNDVILVEDAYVKENNGFKEVHVGSKGKFTLKPEGETIGEVTKTQAKAEVNFDKKQLSSLQPNDTATITGTIVQLFDPRFYPACPECNRKVIDGQCGTHGTVQYKHVPILNFVVDDGTDNIRVVCFRDVVGKVLGLTEEQVGVFRENPIAFQEYKSKLPGTLIEVSGKANKNQMFDRLEFTASNAQPVNSQQALQGLL